MRKQLEEVSSELMILKARQMRSVSEEYQFIEKLAFKSYIDDSVGA